MTTTEDEIEVPTERVAMQWPKTLKEQVREVAGPRGLTEFTINAVEKALLEVSKAEVEEKKDAVDKAREAATQLGEAVTEAVQTAVQTEEAPADAVVSEPADTESAEEPAPEEPPVAPPVTIVKPSDRSSLFERIQEATGGEIDPTSVLRPASEIPVPEKKAEPEPEPEPVPVAPPLPVVDVETPTAPVADICPTCQEPLVDGECWECA